MAKFYAMSALISEIESGGRRVPQCISRVLLVFNADGLRNVSINGCGLTFRCKNFSVDEKVSSYNWRDCFMYELKCNSIFVISIASEFTKPIVIMPYFA